MIRLILEENGTNHDDLVLKYPGGEHRCDTYFIVLEENLSDDEVSTAALQRAIHVLLSQWLEMVEEARVADTLYLPFDFSDQCTAWIRCQFEKANVRLDIGWSLIEGWSFSPKNIRDFVRKVPDFTAIESARPIAMDRASLANAIKVNIKDYE
ncbi:MAG: hypothetical protein KDA54_18450 [Phycisphaerales bacterium]|nr:hypothetical protein [Phycisphaerales bacterium]